jgi:DNA-binding beta-propeller fold protein YncE
MDTTNTVVNTVTVGNGPFGIAYDSGKDEIFVTNAADSMVSVLSDRSASTASLSPTVPEFSSAILASVAAAILVVTFAVVVVRRNKAKKIDVRPT